MLMRTREERADVWIFAKACGARSTNANDAPMIGFLQRRVYGRTLARECERPAGARILAKACVTRMLARSTNANGAPTSGYCADSCARVKGAPTSNFCKGLWGADACAEYECERRTDERILRGLMRTREERADERFLQRRVWRGRLRAEQECEGCADIARTDEFVGSGIDICRKGQ